ncbi:unnamed protein product [Meloidogyne enterolobii]|uniref:Uncharacterized protein n=1 Tax=Meloidogyne enterolobii TaxID=390850 RepID=A0ACB1ADB2_MELEN
MLAATAVNTAVFSTLLFNRNFLQRSAKLLVNQNNLKIASVRNLVAESATKNLEHDKLFKRIDLELRGHDPEVLSSYTTFVSNVCDHLEIEKSQVTETPHLKWLLTTLRDKFAKKKYKVQYEVRTYIRFMHVKYLTGSTASTFLEYIERNIPEGVAMKVTYTEICNLPKTITSNSTNSSPQSLQ